MSEYYILAHNKNHMEDLVSPLLNKDTWAYDYCINDIAKYWDEKNYWDEYPIKFLYDSQIRDESGPALLGGIASVYEGNEFHVKRIFTVAKYRWRGFGTTMLEYDWENAYDDHCTHIRMWCDKDAVPFYEKLGFKMLDEKDGYRYVYALISNKNMFVALNINSKDNSVI